MIFGHDTLLWHIRYDYMMGLKTGVCLRPGAGTPAAAATIENIEVVRNLTKSNAEWRDREHSWHWIFRNQFHALQKHWYGCARGNVSNECRMIWGDAHKRDSVEWCQCMQDKFDKWTIKIIVGHHHKGRNVGLLIWARKKATVFCYRCFQVNPRHRNSREQDPPPPHTHTQIHK